MKDPLRTAQAIVAILAVVAIIVYLAGGLP